ncbi:hypothetical protein GH714_041770 [Hevea brasiliensis]|uniref:AB hydrolase-1 domain-containing protein n=1 Tax=Hevea brasiliensis TaxID=3981 RepID=A0A6A6MX04_HEVBR|nr:hypothetical protein GH714_041770 [Hevea brasiliensis]
MILADKGFDVWIANTRGTRFSRQHTSLQPSQSEFWNWSWDELAAYDLSAVIDYVHEQTGQKLRYVGHSLGTLIALASFSEGLLVDKVQSAALFSPIAYLSNLKTALGNFVARSFVAEDIAFFGIAEFNLLGEPAKRFLETACAAPGVDCFDLLTAITGKNCCLNASAVDFFLENEPQSTSTKNFVHLAQTVRDGVVAKYNYGNSTNMIRYGTSKPPTYNLSNIPQNLPLFLSYGGQDDLSDTQDVQHLLDNLQSHDVTVQFVEDFAHADFVFGVNASDIVYSQVTTQDGYILGLQRIPEGRSASGDSANKPPVLLQHGVLVKGLLVNQVKSAALLSPIAYLSHMKTAFDNAAAKAFAAEATAFFGMAEINPLGEAGQDFKIVCAKPGVNCFNLLRKNCCLNASAMDFFLKNELQSTATKNMVHLAQTVRDGAVAKYNYGNCSSNLIHYGAIKPPIYNLSNIPQNLPLFISYGGQDALSDTEDVAQLLDDLKFHDVLKLTVQFVKDYAHADFVSGVNATDIVYSQVYKFFMNHHF